MILGQIVIERIVESICAEFDPLSFFPGTTPDVRRGKSFGFNYDAGLPITI